MLLSTFFCFALMFHATKGSSIFEQIFKEFQLKLAQDPDETRNVFELISSKGYPAEEHTVMTDDGYFLKIQRIGSDRSSKRPVVFLQHGLLDSSATWVINSANQSLGFMLYDAGYDVWLGNVRGNTYGREHIKYKPTDEEFWDFSWDEMVSFDLPALINYVTNYTKQAQLVYIGHSQGTTMVLSELGTNKDLASKIKLFLALGPVATVGYMKSPVKFFADINPSLIYAVFGRKDFLPSTKFIKWISDKGCTQIPLMCESIMFVFGGPTDNLNNTRLPVITNHAPAGTSVKNMVHYAQSVISKKHQKYDYGKEENMMKYNQPTPPLYNITNVRVPTALYWAKKDWLADPKDVEYIRERLPNIIEDFECENYNHLDFVWAQNANEELYDRMINLMKSYL